MSREQLEPTSERYGRYERLFELASGGMARVFVARLRGEGGFTKLVALKQMHRHLADDETFVRMFLDEARLAANVSSAHVVPTLDLGRTDGGELYLVMELVVGLSLATIIAGRADQDGVVPLPIAVEWLTQAASGLHDAHHATGLDGEPLGIVHRDVSPHNILVGIDGRVRLSDFGVARAMHRLSTTSDGRLKGKHAYCSPEQAKGKPLDLRSDVFSLGVVAWEMLAGRRLFQSESPLDILDRVVHERAPALTEVVADMPEPLSDAVARALEKDPEDRYPTAAELAAAFAEVARSLPSLQDADEVGEFVVAVGGEPLARLQERIRSASSSAESTDSLSDDAEPEAGPRTASMGSSATASAAAGAGDGTAADTLSVAAAIRLEGFGDEEATRVDDERDEVDTVEDEFEERITLLDAGAENGQTDFAAATRAGRRSIRARSLIVVAIVGGVVVASWLALRDGAAPHSSMAGTARSAIIPVAAGHNVTTSGETDVEPSASSAERLVPSSTASATSHSPPPRGSASASGSSVGAPATATLPPTRAAPVGPRPPTPAADEPSAPKGLDELLPPDALDR